MPLRETRSSSLLAMLVICIALSAHGRSKTAQTLPNLDRTNTVLREIVEQLVVKGWTIDDVEKSNLRNPPMPSFPGDCDEHYNQVKLAAPGIGMVWLAVVREGSRPWDSWFGRYAEEDHREPNPAPNLWNFIQYQTGIAPGSDSASGGLRQGALLLSFSIREPQQELAESVFISFFDTLRQACLNAPSANRLMASPKPTISDTILVMRVSRDMMEGKIPMGDTTPWVMKYKATHTPGQAVPFEDQQAMSVPVSTRWRSTMLAASLIVAGLVFGLWMVRRRPDGDKNR